jgi:hypothetical protein
MNKETLRMQMLAGIITESQYKQLLEDMEVVNRILDKISSQGKDSLTPAEKQYLDNYSKGSNNLKEPFRPGNIPEHIEEYLFNMVDLSLPEYADEGEEFEEVWEKNEYGDKELYEDADLFHETYDYIKQNGGEIISKFEDYPDIIFTALGNGDIKFKTHIKHSSMDDFRSWFDSIDPS